jgi:pimeloyl-ACP methyl ester carboxylesterase
VWDIDDFSLDGTSHAPLLTDDIRWQRIVFDDYNTASIQRMNGAVIVTRLLKDVAHGTMTFNYAGDPRPELREFGGPKWRAVLHVDAISPDSLVMQGQFDGHPLTIRLQRSKLHFVLEPNEPHWILHERPVLFN